MIYTRPSTTAERGAVLRDIYKLKNDELKVSVDVLVGGYKNFYPKPQTQLLYITQGMANAVVGNVEKVVREGSIVEIPEMTKASLHGQVKYVLVQTKE